MIWKDVSNLPLPDDHNIEKLGELLFIRQIGRIRCIEQ